MFTGIVSCQGSLKTRSPSADGARMRFTSPSGFLDGAVAGDSVSVSGTCLTLLEPDATGFSADLSAETLRRTTLGSLEPGMQVNLELAMRIGDRLGGHLVSGHIDGRVRLERRQAEGEAQLMHFSLPAELAPYVAVKGSICLDGVSLTVNAVTATDFEVCVIPHTLAVTTLGALGPGSEVNAEVDLVARYLGRLAEFGVARG